MSHNKLDGIGNTFIVQLDHTSCKVIDFSGITSVGSCFSAQCSRLINFVMIDYE